MILKPSLSFALNKRLYNLNVNWVRCHFEQHVQLGGDFNFGSIWVNWRNLESRFDLCHFFRATPSALCCAQYQAMFQTNQHGTQTHQHGLTEVAEERRRERRRKERKKEKKDSENPQDAGGALTRRIRGLGSPGYNITLLKWQAPQQCERGSLVGEACGKPGGRACPHHITPRPRPFHFAACGSFRCLCRSKDGWAKWGQAAQ